MDFPEEFARKDYLNGQMIAQLGTKRKRHLKRFAAFHNTTMIGVLRNAIDSYTGYQEKEVEE